MSTPSPERLLAAAHRLALAAGREILHLYEAGVSVRHKADATPVTEADHAAERAILPGLHDLTPDIPVVSEEAVAAGRMPEIGGGRFWLVDPLDGTKEFLARNGEFTVNIALIEGGRPVLGVVHAPVLPATYTGAGTGTAMAETGDGPARPIAVRKPPAEGLTVCVSRSHANKSALADYLRDLTIRRTVTAGSSIKFCLIAAGEADLYPRFGPTMAWDTAAGHAVLAAAGGHVRTLDGRELTYGGADLRNPHFIARGGEAPEPI